MDVVWTAHAEEAMRDRRISRDDVLATMASPEFIEDDPVGGRIRAFRKLPAHGDRWLRVVYEDVGGQRIVVTLFLDRKAGRKR